MSNHSSPDEVTRRERLAAVLGLLLVALIVTAPLAGHLASALPSDLYDPLFNTYVLAWDASRFARLFDGLWDCPFFYPARDTLAFSDHLFGIAVFTAPVQWATANPLLAYNLAFLFSYVLGGFGMYVLTRELWGRRDAAWIGALAFALAPHRIMHASHLQILMSGWIPIGLYGLHRYFSTGSRRALALFGLATILQALSSAYLMILLLLPVALVAAAETVGWARGRRIGAGRASWLRLATDLGVTGAVCLLALAPTAAAYLRVRRATGFRRSVGEMIEYSGRLADYLRVSDASVWSGLLEHGRLERMLFPGLTIVALALAGVAGAGLAARGRRGGPDAWPGAARRASVTAIYAAILALAVWLSLGPAAPGPYRFLLRALPGFDGLRAPARFVVIASLALAVLAAGGAAWLLGRLAPRARRAAVLAIGIAIAAEGYGGPMRMASFDPAQRQHRELNGWLKAAPPGALLELPVAGPELAPFTLGYQYNTLFHHHPIVNGYSGISSALQDFLGGPGSPVNDPREIPEVIRGLDGIGVRYLVMHRLTWEDRPALGFPSASPIVEAVDGASALLSGRVQFGDTVAWRLAEAPPPPVVAGATRLERLDEAALVATASAMHDRVRYATDGEVETRWFSGARQAGGEWFRVDLATPRDVGRLLVRTGRYGLGDRPRRLVVESQAEGRPPVVLFDGSIVPQLIAGLARGEAGAPAAIDLPANLSRSIVLRQAGSTRTWHWAIHELEVWVRAR